MDVQVARRPATEEERCPFCRGPVDEAVAPCACGVRLHAECRTANGGRCTTLGCASGRPAQAPARVGLVDSSAPWWLVGGGVAFELIGGPLLGPVTALAVMLLVLPPLFLHRALRGGWSILRLVTTALALHALVFVGIERAAPLVQLNWPLVFAGLVLTVALALVGVWLRGARATAKDTSPRWAPGVLGLALLTAAIGASRAGAYRELAALERARWRLASDDPAELRAVLHDLTSPDDQERWAVELAMRDLDRASLIPPLLAALEDPAPWVRFAAATVLARNRPRDPKVLDALLSALAREQDAFAREGLARALRAHASVFPHNDQARVFDALVDLLDDPSAWARLEGIRGLAALGDPRAVPHLVPLLATSGDDGVHPIRDQNRLDDAAAAALAALGDPGRAALAEVFRSHADPAVRERAGAALRR